MKKEEIKIRQSLGEAVPTAIFQSIAKKIKTALNCKIINTATINKIASSPDLKDFDALFGFVKKNPMNLSSATLSKVAEMANTRRTDHAAYFTSKSLITEMMKALPDADKDSVRILEPSVGVGNFIPLIIKKFEGKNVILDVVDIDVNSLEITKQILKNYSIPNNFTINYINADFLLHEFDDRYDYIIGNPPFYKMKSTNGLLNIYKRNAVNKDTTNICSFFLDKALKIGNYVALVFPKFLLNTPEFAPSREYIAKKAVDCIIDFGEKGFPGVLVETLAIFINNITKPSITHVVSITQRKYLIQQQKYIFDDKLPYWIIYRNQEFDNVCKKLDFNVFKVFRDRQITNTMLSDNGEIRVLKSRNINDTGTEIINLDGYDSYISVDEAKKLSVYEYFDKKDIYITPNMTYKPRVMKKPKNVLVNGSLAILVPKNGEELTNEQMLYFSTDEYRSFYQIARNYQTRSLNVDACSVFFYGLLRKTNKKAPITETFIEKDDTQISLFDFVK